MRLLLDPSPPFVRWCQHTTRARRSGRCVCGPRFPDALQKAGVHLQRAESVSYLLHHGGDRIRQPVSRVTPRSLGAIEDSVRFLPEHNDLTYRVIQQMRQRLPRTAHYLLCDTAFFMRLPEEAAFYAVPPELRARGVRRYGGHGLLHQWAWWQARNLCGGKAARMISIHLGDHVNVTALRRGRPVDTTIGFTPVEGIMSHTGCGDIDASVVFELQSSGMSLVEINEMLSARSGFRALAGRRCGFRDLVSAKRSAGKALGRKMLLYSVVRYAGASAALLGGVDVVSFAADDPGESARFILDVCRGLEFLGLRCRPFASGRAGGKIISDNSSEVQVVVLKSELWNIMACQTRSIEED